MDSPAGEERAREPSGNFLAGEIDRAFSRGHSERLASSAARKLRYPERTCLERRMLSIYQVQQQKIIQVLVS